MQIPGVASVNVTRFQRWGKKANHELAKGVLTSATLEILQLANDPNFPERQARTDHRGWLMSDRNQPLAACGCGVGASYLTPASIANLSGQSSLAYRVGTHGSFKATMRAALARQAALGGLTTGQDDDPSIALIDAWAAVLDALTFYQERVANEGYLRTAIEQRSVLELARAIGYELNPGVAAGTCLAFTVDETEGSPASVVLDAGTKVQSVPGQDELPQIFETTEVIEARADWNRLKPQAAERIYPGTGATTISLQGTSTNLKAGDALLIVGDERDRDPTSDRWDLRRVRTVVTVPPSVPTADLNAGRTVVELDRAIGAGSSRRAPATNPRVYVFRQRAALFGYNAPDWLVMSRAIKRAYRRRRQIEAVAAVQHRLHGWGGDCRSAVSRRRVSRHFTGHLADRVADRVRRALFGANGGGVVQNRVRDDGEDNVRGTRWPGPGEKIHRRIAGHRRVRHE